MHKMNVANFSYSILNGVSATADLLKYKHSFYSGQVNSIF